MAGDANNAVRADDRAGLSVTHIILADMRAVGACLGGQVRPVIDEKSRAMRLDKGAKAQRRLSERVVIGALKAQLHAGHIASLKSRLKRALKRVQVNARGRD